MADLDDFFAKKDKKKKAKKFVTANTDVLATKLEESALKEREAEMKATSAAMSIGESTLSIEANTEGKDDEWKEYEERKKDYSGLKIESLKIDNDKDSNSGDDDGELDENGEKMRGKRHDGGPWNKGSNSGAKSDDNDSPSATPEPNLPEAPPTGVQKSAYVPPHLRAGASAPSPSVSSAPKGQQRRNKQAPDISNEFNFPSLAAAAADTPAKATERERDGASFERVRSGGGVQHSKAETPKLTLDNKYAALGSH